MAVEELLPGREAGLGAAEAVIEDIEYFDPAVVASWIKGL